MLVTDCVIIKIRLKARRLLVAVHGNIKFTVWSVDDVIS